MKKKFAKTCTYALLVALVASSIAIAVNNSFVLAQPCQAVLGSPNYYSTQPYYYYQSNFQVMLPVSASCSFFPGQLYATGTAYDTTYNSNIGTANTVLTSTSGGYGYTGQLTFSLPASAQSHSVQFSVSVYGSLNGYYGGYYGAPLLAQTTSTFIISPSYYQGYPTYPAYSTPSYPSYTSYPSYPYSGYYYNYGGYYRSYGGYYYRYYCRSSSSCKPRR